MLRPRTACINAAISARILTRSAPLAFDTAASPLPVRPGARAIARIRFTSRVKRCSHEQDRIEFEPPRRDLVIESRKAAGRRFGADPACSIVTQHWPALIRWFYR